MDKQFYIYLAIMSLITYAIRAIPLVFINKKITNPTIQSFLDYIPYTVLAAMTFPDIFYSTGHLISGIVATVACIGCFIVVMIELILWYNVSHLIFYTFSTHLLTVLKIRTIMYLEIRKGIKKVLVSRVNTAWSNDAND